MMKSTLTSKGQITLPKEIRDHLKLMIGDGLVFRINEINGAVSVEKDIECVECPVCRGYGSFNYNGLPCFVCDQTQFVSARKSVLEEIFAMKGIKYGVSVQVKSQEFIDGGIKLLSIPKVTLTSNKYINPLLDIAHDYYQMKFIDECVRREDDRRKYLIPSEVVLEEILSLLKRESAQYIVRKWFHEAPPIGPLDAV